MTIIILLILAGVSLNLVAGSEGILRKTERAVNKNNVETGKEQVELKIQEYIQEFYENKYVHLIIGDEDKIADYIEGKMKNEVEIGNYVVTIKNKKVVLSQRGTTGSLMLAEGTLTEKGRIQWRDGENIKNSDLFEYCLKLCGINKEYTIEQVVNNTDNILSQIFENKQSTQYIFDNHLSNICDSTEAMKILGKSKVAGFEAVSNHEIYSEILKSSNYSDFEKETLLEVMTTNQSPNGKSTASSTYMDEDREPYKAFDGMVKLTKINGVRNFRLKVHNICITHLMRINMYIKSNLG